MNGKDLLIALGDISHKYYDEAENETIASSHKTLKRPLLIAAIVALMLFLMGCAVVYALRLQDMSIGKETYTQYYDDAGKAIEPTEKIRDVVTLYGHSGDPIQQAMTEWYEFTENYDPNGEYLTNEPDLPEIPNQYEHTYYCYTQEMMDALDAIVQKHGLKLLEAPMTFQRYQIDIFLEASGIRSLLLPDAKAEVMSMTGVLYPPYNFTMDFELSLDRFDQHLYAGLSYARKDYMPTILPGGMDLDSYTQWDHTAPDGTQLLLALNNKGRGYAIADLDNTMLVLSVYGNLADTLYPNADQIISKEDLEAIADVFDYSISPNMIDTESVREQLEKTEAAYQAEHAYVPEVYSGFQDYLITNYTRENDDLLYTFYDLTGDGENELLIGVDGYFYEWLTIRDGQTLRRIASELYLCEGCVLESFRGNWKYQDFEERSYYEPLSDTVVAEIYPEEESVGTKYGKKIGTIRYTKGQWYKIENQEDIFDLTEISADEANELISRYPRIQLDWKPLMDYPLDGEGKTLGDSIREKDVRVSYEELIQLYVDRLNGMKDMYYTHYRIMDFNGDGVEDLLLSGDGDSYWNVLTYRYGRIMSIYAKDFVLCEDGVVDHCSRRYEEPAIEIQEHEFVRMVGFEEESLDFIAFNKSTASWECDRDGTPMDTAEAEAILEKYPQIDQGMLPISDLLN